MTKLHVYFLVLKYPELRKMIKWCYHQQKYDELLDYLFQIETEDDHRMYARNMN